MADRIISPEQACKLKERIARDLRYYARLRQRMELLGFTPADPLYRSVCQAYHAVQELHIRAHYESCTSGVGRQ